MQHSEGVFPAREFVWWYNGHPEYCTLPINLKQVCHPVLAASVRLQMVQIKKLAGSAECIDESFCWVHGMWMGLGGQVVELAAYITRILAPHQRLRENIGTVLICLAMLGRHQTQDWPNKGCGSECYVGRGSCVILDWQGWP